MARKTNCIKNGKAYCRITRTVGKRLNKDGLWVPNKKEFYGSTQKEAIQKYEDYMQNQRNGIVSDDACFGEIADHFIYNIFWNDTHYAESTQEMYSRAYERYLRQAPLARLPLESMTSSMLQQFYNELDCTPSGLDALHKMLIICFRYFSREGYSRNLTNNLILPKKKNKKNIKPRSKNRNIEVWEAHELELITANLGNNRIRFLILLAMYTGCRISELLAIEYGDIHDGVLNISKQIINAPVREKNKIICHQLEVSKPKTIHSYRAIPLTEGLLEELERHRKWHQDEMKENGYSTNYIFTTKTGQLCDRHNIRRACDRYYKKIGITPRKFHAYRSTFATNLCKLNVPIQVVSALLGHSSIQITAKYYIDISNAEMEDAVNKLQLHTG